MCENCIYNQEFDSWPGYRLPCGQFNCWLEIEAELEEEEINEDED